MIRIFSQTHLLLGDFNIPNLSLNNTRTPKAEILINFSHLFALDQFNTVLNVNDVTLDLVLANVICKVVRESFPLVDEDSHHPAINIFLSLRAEKSKSFPINVK